MTGGLGFVSDMMNRDRENRQLLKNKREFIKRTAGVHSNAKTPDSEATEKGHEPRTKESKEVPFTTNKTETIVFGIVIGAGLVLLVGLVLFRLFR